MIRPKLKTILLSFSILVTLTIIILAVFGFLFFKRTSQDMQDKLLQKKFLSPTELYSAPISFHLNQLIEPQEIRQTLKQQGFRERLPGDRILQSDFLIADIEDCKVYLDQLSAPPLLTASGCFIFQNVENNSVDSLQSGVFFNNNHEVVFQFKGSLQNTLESPDLIIELAPVLLAQYVNQEPILNDTQDLRAFPPACLNAVLSIEDPRFLEHQGVSLRSILRAVIANLLKGRLAQGGSTITQQTVKNYFLTSERTLSRKLKEAAMSLMLEKEFTKDQILETYLNIIYMGQSGSFQLRGFASASRFYFNKDLVKLNLAECSLLAAIINSPGLYNPFKHPENALRRRSLVLQKIKEHGLAPVEQIEIARQQPLPQKTELLAQETAPYFIDAVHRELQSLNIPLEGAKIYTSLNPQLQQWAETELQSQISQLEKDNKKISKLAEQGKKLEASLISMNLKTGLVDVLVGGRGYKTTQFNRALDAHRQIGSLIKPFVYLTALEKGTHPTELIQDAPTQFKFGKQIWKPDNYEKKFYGEVPVFFALVNSLNAATAQLGMSIGLDPIIETLKLFGLTSKIEAYPSLLLGSFELFPIEIFKMYATLATLGRRQTVGWIRTVNLYNKEVFKKSEEVQQIMDPTIVSELVGILKQNPQLGTAQSMRRLGFQKIAAGKTGTTNDNRDAWFVGFTPSRLTLVWIGYDDNTPHRLTGGSAAVPLWTSFMLKATASDSDQDFPWPETVQKTSYNLMDFKVYRSKAEESSNTEPFDKKVELIESR